MNGNYLSHSTLAYKLWQVNNKTGLKNVNNYKQDFNLLLFPSIYSHSHVHTAAYVPSIVQINAMTHYLFPFSTTLQLLLFSVSRSQRSFDSPFAPEGDFSYVFTHTKTALLLLC